MLLELLKKKWKYIFALALSLIMLVGGYQYGLRSVKPKIIENTVTVEVEKIVTKEVLVNTTKKAEKTNKTTTIKKNKDGSEEIIITEKTDSTEESSSNSSKESSKDSSKTEEKTQSVAQVKLNKYYLGLSTYFDANPKIFQNLDPHYGITAGVRAIGNLWADTEYRHHSKTVSFGLHFEF